VLMRTHLQPVRLARLLKLVEGSCICTALMTGQCRHRKSSSLDTRGSRVETAQSALRPASRSGSLDLVEHPVSSAPDVVTMMPVPSKETRAVPADLLREAHNPHRNSIGSATALLLPPLYPLSDRKKQPTKKFNRNAGVLEGVREVEADTHSPDSPANDPAEDEILVRRAAERKLKLSPDESSSVPVRGLQLQLLGKRHRRTDDSDDIAAAASEYTYILVLFAVILSLIYCYHNL